MTKIKFEQCICFLDKAMTCFEVVVTTITFASMTCLVLAAVISRFILHIPFKWVEEASRYLMVTGIFLGISMGVKNKTHLGFTTIINALPKAYGNVISYIRSLLEIFAYAYFAYCSIKFCTQVRASKQISPALLFPMWYVYIPLVIAFVFSTIRTLIIFYNNFIVKKEC